VLEDVSKAVCDGLNEAMTHYKSFLKSDALSQNSPFQGDALLDPDAAYFATLHEIKKDIMEDAKGGQRFRSREEKRRKLNDAISTGQTPHPPLFHPSMPITACHVTEAATRCMLLRQ